MRKLVSNLEYYLEQVLNMHGWEPVDVGDLAHNKDSDQLIRLFEMVVCVAIQCPLKEKYIGRIQQLPEAAQEELMVFIKRILDKCRDSYSPAASEIDKIRLLNQELTREVENLNLELAETRKEHELYKSRLPKLVSSAEDNTTLTLELETQVTKLTETNKELAQQLAEQRKKHAAEIAEIRDDLDVANERILQLRSLEGTLEKLKQKSEEAAAARKKLQELQTYNDSLCERLRLFEEAQTSGLSVHETLAVYKDQLTQEKNISVTLYMRIESLEEELRDTQRSRQEAAERCKALEARAQCFAEQLTRLPAEETGGPLAEDLGQSLQTQSHLLTQQTLEEIRRHFDEQLNTITREKLLIEEKYRKAVEELETIRKNPVVVRVEDQETKALLRAKEEAVQALQRENGDLAGRLEKLDSEVQKTRQWAAENDRLKAEKEQLMQENAKVYREKDEISQRYLEHKDSAIILSADITSKDKELALIREENKRLKEETRELLETQTLTLERVSSEPVEIPEQYKALEYEKEAMRVQVENANLKLKLREMQDDLKSREEQISTLREENQKAHISLQEAEVMKVELTSLRSNKSHEESRHKQTMSHLEETVESRESQIRHLTDKEKEMRKQINVEERLMSVALHELGMEVFRRSAERNSTISARTNKA